MQTTANVTLIDTYKTFLRIVRGYESEHLNHSEISNNNVVCTLFKQPLSNKSILCGIFGENGEIFDLFENKWSNTIILRISIYDYKKFLLFQ